MYTLTSKNLVQWLGAFISLGFPVSLLLLWQFLYHLSALKHSNFFIESFEEKKYSMMLEYNSGSKPAAKEGTSNVS